MLQRLIMTVAAIAALSISLGLRDASAAGNGAGQLGGAGHFGGSWHAGSAWHGGTAWHGGQGFGGWQGGSAWHGGSASHAGKGFTGAHGGSGWRGGKGWRGATAGWGFYDPFIGYPYFGFPYAESPQYLLCLRRIRLETPYGVSWRSVWTCN
jgi:hypothetical protein